MAAKFVQVHGRCDCISASVGGSEQAVSSTSHLRGPTLCAQSCLLLESEASAELGAKFSDDAESFGSPQAVMDDCETRRDCLIDSQCKPPSNDRPDTLALYTLQPTLTRHTVTLITTFCKKSLFCRVRICTPSRAFHVTKSNQLYAFDERCISHCPPKCLNCYDF